MKAKQYAKLNRYIHNKGIIANLIENPIILIPIIKFTIQIEVDSIKPDKSETKIFLSI